MTKLLIWIVLVFVALFALRLIGIAKGKRRAAEASASSSRTPAAETMVRCARCGVYLPRADSVPSAVGPVCGAPGCAQSR